ncbi:MAG: tRNA lysidine(34) synthetase TilS [Proteobacteria bacterium]|nr:tRNA lysidine(34) synthetase TilS [Pseudomonadota bacterium]
MHNKDISLKDQTSIVNKFTEIICAYNINGEQKIALAISGGSDSMCLALLCTLSIASAKLPCEIIGLIVDHGIRSNSKHEAIKTQLTLQKYSIKSKILTCVNLQSTMSNMHHHARIARYELMLEYCKKKDIKFLFTGHHMNDQAETILMNIARGSGLDGICGINQAINMMGVNVIRPMLFLQKSHIISILQNKGWGWVDDESNYNLKFKRSRFRQLINAQSEIPVERINLLAKNANRTRSFLIQHVKEIFHSICHISEFGYLTVKSKAFYNLHEEMQTRLLDFILQILGKSSYQIRMRNLQTILSNLIQNKISTFAGYIAKPNDNLIVFYREIALIRTIPITSKEIKKYIWDNRFIITFKDCHEVNLEIAPVANVSNLNKIFPNFATAEKKAMLSAPALYKNKTPISIISSLEYQDNYHEFSVTSLLKERLMNQHSTYEIQ